MRLVATIYIDTRKTYKPLLTRFDVLKTKIAPTRTTRTTRTTTLWLLEARSLRYLALKNFVVNTFSPPSNVLCTLCVLINLGVDNIWFLNTFWRPIFFIYLLSQWNIYLAIFAKTMAQETNDEVNIIEEKKFLMETIPASTLQSLLKVWNFK